MEEREHSIFNNYKVGEVVRITREGPNKGFIGIITKVSQGWMGGPSNLTLKIHRSPSSIAPYFYVIEESAVGVEPA